MEASSIRWPIIGLTSFFALQAAVLQATQSSLLLTTKSTPVYIFEGDMISTQAPTSAEDASKTETAVWVTCRYWTGLRIDDHVVPSAESDCPRIGWNG
jgi:hypothetical protein